MTSEPSDTDVSRTGARIVVGVDGSEPSKLALRWAAQLAPTFDAAIDAVGAWHFPPYYGWNYTPAVVNPEADAAKYLAETVDEVFGGVRPLGMRLLVYEGVAAKVLLDLSEGATLLILGSRGHGGFAGLLLGSVSASCAEHATCPVLVVHGDQPHEAAAGAATIGQPA